MAALWMSRFGIKTRIIDRRERHDRVGQADGIQIRTLELFDSFGIADTLLQQSCHMLEVSFSARCSLFRLQSLTHGVL